MLRAFALAFRQLPEPEMRGPLLRALLWSIGAFALVWLAVGWTVTHRLSENALVERLVDVLGVILVPLATWFLFPTLALAILGLYSESIIRAVERRYYPGLPESRRIPLIESITSAVRLGVISLLVNLLALPIYLLVPVGNFVLFLALNGYVLGREYFDQVALRHMEDRVARNVWRDQRFRYILTGSALAGLFLIPGLNLVAPILGLAATVHLVASETGVPVTQRRQLG